MPRQDVPYGGAICRLKERIAEIFDKLGEKLHTINGVPGDGDGNVKIVSGSSAVVITNDPTQNEIEVSLDTSQLPAASVSSVNGQTGAVALDAGDIPTVGGDVQADLQDLANDISGNTAAINAEVLARQGADSTLQTNINNITASLPTQVVAAVAADPTIALLVSADSDNVKLTGNQSINGIKTVPTAATGSSTQQIANGEKVQNDLDNYTPMVRTSNNQNIGGVKTFTAGRTVLKDGTTEMTYRIDSTHGTERYAVLELSNPNNNYMACLQFVNLPDGTCKLQFYRYNTQTQQAEVRDIVTIN